MMPLTSAFHVADHDTSISVAVFTVEKKQWLGRPLPETVTVTTPLDDSSQVTQSLR